MALPFFYEPNIKPGATHFTLSSESSRHCIQVLRMKTGDYLNLTDGKGLLCKTSIVSEDKRKCTVIVESETFTERNTRKVDIAISLLKNANRIEWFLEKVTEIGIHEVFPLLCNRTETIRFKTDRIRNILVAAMLQSQQVWLPVLHDVMPLKPFIESTSNSQKLIAHCEDDNKNEIRNLPPSDNTLILIGPEGDFTPEEIQLAISHQFIPVTLGNTRLRAETAGVVAVALLMNY